MTTHKEVGDRLQEKLERVFAQIVEMTRALPPYDGRGGPLFSIPLTYTTMGVTWGMVSMVKGHMRQQMEAPLIQGDKMHAMLDCLEQAEAADKALLQARDHIEKLIAILDKRIYKTVPIISLAVDAADQAMRMGMKEMDAFTSTGKPRSQPGDPLPPFPADITAALQLMMLASAARCRDNGPGHEECHHDH